MCVCAMVDDFAVIQWLNKQINETQLQHQRAGTFEMPAANFRPSGSALVSIYVEMVS